MSEGVARTVLLGSMAYVDPSGRVRRADCGDTIEVHADHVARFDRLNVLQAAPEQASPEVEVVNESAPEPSAKRRPGRPRKAASED